MLTVCVRFSNRIETYGPGPYPYDTRLCRYGTWLLRPSPSSWDTPGGHGMFKKVRKHDLTLSVFSSFLHEEQHKCVHFRKDTGLNRVRAHISSQCMVHGSVRARKTR